MSRFTLKSLAQLTSISLLATASVRGESHLDSAQRALAEELPDIAALRIEAFLEKEDKLSAADKQKSYLLLGEAYLRSGNPAQALASLAKAPDATDNRLNFWQGLGLAHQGNLPDAIEQLSKVAESNELFPQALFNIVEIQERQGNSEEALAALARLRESNPKFQTRALVLTEAQLFLQAGEPAKAYKSLATLNDKARTLPEALLVEGKIELEAGEPNKALKAFSAIEPSPENPAFDNLVTLGKIDASLALEQNAEALTFLLELLSEKASPSLLKSLSVRFERIVSSANETDDLAAILIEFVSPESLGEDSNYATPAKLLASYYLTRISPPESARSLTAQALAFDPEPELIARFHLELARIAMEENNLKEANAELKTAQTSAPDSTLSAQAADLRARLALKDKDHAAARSLFAQAALHPDTDFAEQALLNQAVIELSENPDSSLSALSARLKGEESRESLDLEKALAAARKNSKDAISLLQDFINKYPAHFRITEARLALIELLLNQSQPNLESISRELAALPSQMKKRESRKAFQLSHRLGVITGDWSDAVLRGDNHLKAFPEDEKDPYYLLRLAESHFREKNFNRAHLLYSETAKLPEIGEIAQIANYFSARANLMIPTPESTAEGLETLDRLIEQAGPLATRARLLKARTLLEDSGKPRQCLQTLEGIPGKPGDQPEAAFLTAQAYRELASKNPELVERAVGIYQELIDDPRTSYALSNELHYQIALTYRENGLLSQALESCLKVVDRENRRPDEKEVEWTYYYRCGFEAIDILLEGKGARAALYQAQKLAATKGPSAKQAQERARQIQLDHQLWTD